MPLPDYLTELTEEAIRKRMLDRVPSDVDKSEGSFIWDSLAPAAFELYGASIWAQEVLRRAFASTTYGEYLDLRCEEHGVTRRPAERARGEVKFTGTAGAVVPMGTIVATAADPIFGVSSVEFMTMAAVTLDSLGVALAPVIATEAGLEGNVPVGAISLLLAPQVGVSGVTNNAAFTGGAQAESDEALLGRFLLKVRSPGTSGNKADYVQWALSVPGIGAAQVSPLWNGPGTVKVYVLDNAMRAPTAALVTAVQDDIAPAAGQGAGKAPIGAAVTVVAGVEVSININVQVSLTPGATLSSVKTLIENGVRDYLKQLAFVDPLVRYTRISAILLDISPIVDFNNLTVNGGSANITMASGQAAVLGTVTVS